MANYMSVDAYRNREVTLKETPQDIQGGTTLHTDEQKCISTIENIFNFLIKNIDDANMKGTLTQLKAAPLTVEKCVLSLGLMSENGPVRPVSDEKNTINGTVYITREFTEQAKVKDTVVLALESTPLSANQKTLKITNVYLGVAERASSAMMRHTKALQNKVTIRSRYQASSGYANPYSYSINHDSNSSKPSRSCSSCTIL